MNYTEFILCPFWSSCLPNNIEQRNADQHCIVTRASHRKRTRCILYWCSARKHSRSLIFLYIHTHNRVTTSTFRQTSKKYVSTVDTVYSGKIQELGNFFHIYLYIQLK